MAKYVNITKEEMEKFLLPLGFQPIQLPRTYELVYAKRVDADGLALSLRVYTGIVHGRSRDVGTDAIRCNIFWRTPDGVMKKVASSKRVHRVRGWRENLADRLNSLSVGPKCSKCGAPMVERKSNKGEMFYGCSSYPACTNTQRIGDE